MKELDICALKNSLSKCFELEGLLQLAIERQDTTPQEVIDLIKSKIALLYNSFNCKCEVPSEVNSDEVEIEVEAEAQDTPECKNEEIQPSHDDETPKTPAPLVECAHVVRLQFTLNDKFRFNRELFAGCEADFEDAVSAISQMNSKSDIEDFLYNDLCFDENNPTVQEFLSIATSNIRL